MKPCGLPVIMVTIAMTACHGTGPTPGGLSGSTFQLKTDHGTYAGASALNAYFWARSEAEVQFNFSVPAGDYPIGFVSELRPEVLTSRSATVGVTSGPIGLGLANLSANGMPYAAGFDGAAASMTFAAETVTGQITPVENRPFWTFAGKVTVGCWVPASALPTPPTGGAAIDDGSGDTVVPDQELETPQCQPLKPLTLR
jgi:hypothetical protein